MNENDGNIIPDPEQHETEPGFNDLTIFTSTLYKEDESSLVRQELAIKLFENARNLGIKVVVDDGGSNAYFLEKISQFNNVTIVSDSKNASMGEGRRAALRKAVEDSGNSQNHYYLWVEPEKEGLISPDGLTAILDPLRSNQTDIVVPARKDMSTLPNFQAWIEKRANEAAGKIARPEGIETDEEVWDLWFGPKAFNATGANYFLNYQSDLDKWDSIIKPVLNAYQDGKRVTTVPVDFRYTEEQKANEDESDEFKKKRVVQYGVILAELGSVLWKQILEDHRAKLAAQKEKTPAGTH